MAYNPLNANGQATMANSTPVVIASNQTVVPVTSYPLITASGTMTRPGDTTAYAFGDLVANSTTAASVTAIVITSAARGTDVAGRITGATLDKSGTGITNALFRAHIFGANPVASAPTNGDNGAFAPANRAGYFGYIDFTLTVFAFGDGVRACGTIGVGSYMNFTPLSGTANLNALLECRGAYTPGNAEVFTLTLQVE